MERLDADEEEVQELGDGGESKTPMQDTTVQDYESFTADGGESLGESSANLKVFRTAEMAMREKVEATNNALNATQKAMNQTRADKFALAAKKAQASTAADSESNDDDEASATEDQTVAAPLDGVLLDITLTPIYLEDTKYKNFDDALKNSVAMITGTPMTADNVEVLSKQTNTGLSQQEFQQLMGDVGTKMFSYAGKVKKIKTPDIYPVLRVKFMIKTGRRGNDSDNVRIIARKMNENIDKGLLIRLIRDRLKELGFKETQFYGKEHIQKLTLMDVALKPKMDNSTGTPTEYVTVRNISTSNCMKSTKDLELEDKWLGSASVFNFSNFGWKKFLKPTHRRDFKFAGPYVAYYKDAANMRELDFKSGQFLVEATLAIGSANNPAYKNTYLYLGGNSSCHGLVFFIKGTKVGLGNQCYDASQKMYDIGASVGQTYRIKFTYQWGKLKVYKDGALVMSDVLPLHVPIEGAISIGAGQHDDAGFETFYPGTITNVVISNEAAAYTEEATQQMTVYNCTDSPCMGTWVPEEQFCAPKSFVYLTKDDKADWKQSHPNWEGPDVPLHELAESNEENEVAIMKREVKRLKAQDIMALKSKMKANALTEKPKWKKQKADCVSTCKANGCNQQQQGYGAYVYITINTANCRSCVSCQEAILKTEQLGHNGYEQPLPGYSDELLDTLFMEDEEDDDELLFD